MAVPEPFDSSVRKYLRVSDLNVDHSYQRPLSMAFVNRAVKNFNPNGIGLIVVNQRQYGSGQYWVVDGQHRVAIVRRLLGNDAYIEAEVFFFPLIKDEAVLFSVRNTVYRTNAYVRFRADVIAEVEDAVRINRIVEDLGFKVGGRKSLYVIGCPSALRDVYKKGGEDKLRATLTLIPTCWPSNAAGVESRWDTEIIVALASFLKQYGDVAKRDRLHRVLSSVTPNMVLAHITMLAGHYQARQPRGAAGSSWLYGAEAIRTLYNRGLSEKTRI